MRIDTMIKDILAQDVSLDELKEKIGQDENGQWLTSKSALGRMANNETKKIRAEVYLNLQKIHANLVPSIR